MFPGVEALTDQPIRQIAWVVPDVDQAAIRWVEMMAAGPFFVTRLAKISFAVAWWRGVQVELIHQTDDLHPFLTEMAVPGQSRIAHVQWFHPDPMAEIGRLNGLGFATLHLETDAHGPSWAMVDTRPVLGVMAEISPDDPRRRASKLATKRAAEQWDGSDPVRPIEQLRPFMDVVA